MEIYLSTGRACALLGCSRQTVIRMCDKGVLKHHFIAGSKHRRVHATSLLKVAIGSGMPIEGRLKLLKDRCETDVSYKIGETNDAATGKLCLSNDSERECG